MFAVSHEISEPVESAAAVDKPGVAGAVDSGLSRTVVNLKLNFGELMITCLCWMVRASVISRLGCEDFTSQMAPQTLDHGQTVQI